MTIHPNRSATLPEPNESFDPSNINDSDFYLNGNLYQHARRVDVAEQAGVNLSNYLVPLTFYTGDLDFASTQSDGSDLRFSDAYGNEFRYWVEKWDVTNEVGVVWVEVPDIPASGSVEYYMFYGNSSVAAKSTTAVWNYFDDFTGDLSNWTQHQYSWTIDSNNRAYKDGGTDGDRAELTYDGATWDDLAVEVLAERTGSGSVSATAHSQTVYRYDRSNRDHYLNRCRASSDEAPDMFWYNGSFNNFASFTYSHSIGTYRYMGASDGSTHRGTLRDTDSNVLTSDTASDSSKTAADYAGVAAVEDEERFHWVGFRDFVEPEPSVTVGEEGTA